MKRMSDKTKKIIYWTMFGCTILFLIAAFVVGLVGFVKNIDFLTHLSLIFIPCGLFVNVINILAFKPNGKKATRDDKENSEK